MIVEDSQEKSFVYDIDSETTHSPSTKAAHCTITVSNDTFERLFLGHSTFEQEVHNGTLVISGDSNVLRDFGKLLRSQS